MIQEDAIMHPHVCMRIHAFLFHFGEYNQG
jgi:hypothetical protein